MTAAGSMWGCVPELAADCVDMTNASSAYLGILVGAIIGGLISWLIYSRQKKTAEKQDFTLERIKELNMRHEKMLETIEAIEEHNKVTLEKILSLEKKIAELVKASNDKRNSE
jgi:gas vesicle protein